MRGVVLRRIILGIAAIAVCGAMQLVAQQAPPHPPPADLSGPHKHGQPIPAKPQSTTEGILGAISLGSPLLLDKGWRVGITANPDAANPSSTTQPGPSGTRRSPLPTCLTRTIRLARQNGTSTLTGHKAINAPSPGFGSTSSWLQTTDLSLCLSNCRSARTQPWESTRSVRKSLPTASSSNPRGRTATIRSVIRRSRASTT